MGGSVYTGLTNPVQPAGFLLWRGFVTTLLKFCPGPGKAAWSNPGQRRQHAFRAVPSKWRGTLFNEGRPLPASRSCSTTPSDAVIPLPFLLYAKEGLSAEEWAIRVVLLPVQQVTLVSIVAAELA